MPTVTASADSVTYSNPGIHVAENFEAVLATGLDEVYKRQSAFPMEGAQYFRKKSSTQRTMKFQSHYGLGVVEQNRDADNLPYDEKGLGFDWEVTPYTFRGAIRIEKELKEDELYGAIGDLQEELVASERKAKELIMADVFNRCLGTSGAPFICEDGMYLIDSARPNAFKKAATWSNLESASAITINSLYTAQLNFSAYKDDRGYLSPKTLKHIIIRPTDEKTLWEILKSDLRPSDAMNASNYMQGRFQYSVYNHLTAAVVLYMADDPSSSQNELVYVERVAPELETWKDGSNPDITHQRIRTRYWMGCGRPCSWRGGTVS